MLTRKIAAIALAVGATTAVAQTPAGPQGMTLDAFQTAARHRMLQADADGDGKISKAEWIAARGARGGGAGGEQKRDPGMMFDRLDANHDGYLDAAEIDAMTAKRFARMDSNKDGIVTPDERAAMRAGRGGD